MGLGLPHDPAVLLAYAAAAMLALKTLPGLLERRRVCPACGGVNRHQDGCPWSSE